MCFVQNGFFCFMYVLYILGIWNESGGVFAKVCLKNSLLGHRYSQLLLLLVSLCMFFLSQQDLNFPLPIGVLWHFLHNYEADRE